MSEKSKGQVITQVDMDAAQLMEETAQLMQKTALLLAKRHQKIGAWVKTSVERGDSLREDALFSLGTLSGELDGILNGMQNYLADYAKFREVFMTSTAHKKKEELH